MNQFHNTDNCYTGGTASVFNGGAGIAINGGAVSLDSQGCKPLVSILDPGIAERWHSFSYRISRYRRTTFKFTRPQR